VPELPEMQALSERLDELLVGHHLEAIDQLGFSALKTAAPDPQTLVGDRVTAVTRRGKYLVLVFDGGRRVLVHLSQGGRLDVESPPKKTRPRGALVRLAFEGGLAVLVREHGTQRKAGWWVLEDGDDGPLATLGPEPDDPAFAAWLATTTDTRHLHTVLRDQHVVAGIGRGWGDDIMHRARLSPFGAVRSLAPAQRAELLEAIQAVLAAALDKERTRTGGLSDARLGERFAIHNHAGDPCLRCAGELQRVSFESYELVYCPTCQTNGRILADRRLSRLLR
jgi:formamidopyrimidine-DNA glycosylase